MKILILKLDDNKVDRQGHILPTDAEVQFMQMIPVYLNFDRNNQLGWAQIERNDKHEFFAIIPDDIVKGIGADIEFLTPAIGAKVLKKHTEDYDIIDGFQINELALVLGQNCDDTIKSIGEQLREVV